MMSTFLTSSGIALPDTLLPDTVPEPSAAAVFPTAVQEAQVAIQLPVQINQALFAPSCQTLPTQLNLAPLAWQDAQPAAGDTLPLILASTTASTYNIQQLSGHTLLQGLDGLYVRIQQPQPQQQPQAQQQQQPRPQPQPHVQPQLHMQWPSDTRSSTIFFAGVTPIVTAETLLSVFAQFGRVMDLNLFRPYKGCRTSKGCGLVAFANTLEAAAALDTLNGKYVWPGARSPMVVEWCDPHKQLKNKRTPPLIPTALQPVLALRQPPSSLWVRLQDPSALDAWLAVVQGAWVCQACAKETHTTWSERKNQLFGRYHEP